MKLFLFLLFLINLTASAKEPKPQYFVDAMGGLHLREEPSEKSKSILLIPYKSEIQLIKEVGDLVEINKKSGIWTKIQFGNKTGYAFGAYINKYILLDIKFSPNEKLFYEYYTPLANYYNQCSYFESDDLEKECFIKIYRSNDQKLIKILTHNDIPNPLNEPRNNIWFGTLDWYDNKSFLIINDASDGVYSSTDIGYLNIHSRKYNFILKNEMGECNNKKDNVIELIEFEKVFYYKIISENPKIQTGFFTMLKPKADDYDKLLETCKRDLKNSVLVKPTTVIRKNYTFKINSKKASLYFKGKDILNRDNID